MTQSPWRSCSRVFFGKNDLLSEVRTSDPASGAADWIFAGDGPDTVLGGSGADQIDAGNDAGA